MTAFNSRGGQVFDHSEGTKRMEYVDATLTYIGEADIGVAEASPRWLVKKITSSGGQLTGVRIGYGSWDNRATLTYA